MIAGWREWVALPGAGVEWMKAKLDTGARSSAIHAFDLRSFDRDGHDWVRFSIHPWQRSADDAVELELPVLDKREVRSSNGLVEDRYAVELDVTLVGRTFTTAVTLSNRDEMGFRMLVGREALVQGSWSTPECVVRRWSAASADQTPDLGALMPRESFGIGTVRIRAGSARALELPITRLVTGADVSLPVRVVHGREDGPTVWLSAAVHGDEVVGVEVIRQVLAALDP